MAQTGRAGGRQNLENTRVKGDIHSSVPEVPNAHDKSSATNASTRTVAGAPNTNRKARGAL